MHLAFPSAASAALRRSIIGFDALLHTELELRRGSANDCLDAVRSIVSHLSFQLSTNVRLAKSVKTTTRAWGGVKILEQSLSYHRRVYGHMREVICREDPTPDNLQQFQVLSKADCHKSVGASHPNARGKSQSFTSWIWATIRGGDPTLNSLGHLEDPYLLECK